MAKQYFFHIYFYKDIHAVETINISDDSYKKPAWSFTFMGKIPRNDVKELWTEEKMKVFELFKKDFFEGKIKFNTHHVNIFIFSKTEFKQIVTKRKLDLMKLITKTKHKTIEKLSRILNRKVKAVREDVKDLLKYGIIKYEIVDNKYVPSITRDTVFLEVLSLNKHRKHLFTLPESRRERYKILEYAV